MAARASWNLRAGLRPALAGLLALPAAAQGGWPNFGPMTPDLRLSQASSYDQIWAQVAHGTTSIATAWSMGQDVWARFYGLDLAPLTVDLHVNSTLANGVQDEPAVGWSRGGNALVAWSERDGYDGQLMGIFARLYDATGQPLGAEFQVNTTWQASQWRPLVAPRRGSGFLVAWSGDWDGDSFFRLYRDDGVPASGEVRVNVMEFDAQVDPVLAQSRNGTIFVAFVDFSGFGGVGSGLNLWGRTFDAAGVPLVPFEFPLTTFASNGDQREPRVATDGLGRFVVVWQDTLLDGSGNGIVARRFDDQGLPLGPEFLVNATTASDQLEARVAADASGGFVVTWQDWSQGVARVVGQRFDPDGLPLGGEFQVNETAASVGRHEVSLDPGGRDFLFAFDAPGDGSDVFLRRFVLSDVPIAYCEGKTSSQGCLPFVGSTGSPALSDPEPLVVTASLVLSHRFGFLVYALSSAFTPFQGGTLCVGQPFRRVGLQDSGGNPPPVDCSGTFAYDFTARVLSGADPELVPGATVSAQWYYRDLADPTGFGTGLTDALRFTIAP